MRPSLGLTILELPARVLVFIARDSTRCPMASKYEVEKTEFDIYRPVFGIVSNYVIARMILLPSPNPKTFSMPNWHLVIHPNLRCDAPTQAPWTCTHSVSLSKDINPQLTILQRPWRSAPAGFLQTRGALLGSVVNARSRLQTADIVHARAQALWKWWYLRRSPSINCAHLSGTDDPSGARCLTGTLRKCSGLV